MLVYTAVTIEIVTFNNLTITINKDTQVYLDLVESIAWFDGNCFDIQQHEYSVCC